jgi:hypothetical protein
MIGRDRSSEVTGRPGPSCCLKVSSVTLKAFVSNIYAIKVRLVGVCGPGIVDWDPGHWQVNLKIRTSLARQASNRVCCKYKSASERNAVLFVADLL